MNAKQIELSAAASQEQSASMRIGPAQNAVSAARANESTASSARDAATSAVNACHANVQQPGACSAVEAAASNAESQYQQASSERQRAESDLNDAQSSYSSAQSRRSQAESESQSAAAHFRSTPPQISVDKHCNHDYPVDTVSVRGNVELALKGESLYDTTPVLNESVSGHFDATDETFKAEQGFCAEVASGKALNLPREPDVRKKVVENAITNAQTSIIGAFERYRKDLLTKARASDTDKKNDDAADLYARFVFTSTKPGADEGKAKESLSKIVGVTPDAVDLAMKR